ncbi:hypothetical protein KDK77_11050 [bacterium]|nr:hypothetical protein [bacterium]MCP5462484.1 hypothetical protein [bacterium]
MKKNNEYQQNLKKLKSIVRCGQILPCRIIKRLNDREVVIAIHALEIKAYTNIDFEKDDKAFLRIDQIGTQMRFKLLDEKTLSNNQNYGVDYTI